MLEILKAEVARLRRDESGAALMVTLSIALVLYILCAGVYVVGETARQKVELQNAVDSAAYSAALVQADGLSRMAMINRALSWSYVQLTNMQIDYITYKWLNLVYKRFKEDEAMCRNYNSCKMKCIHILCGKCSNGNMEKRGTGWFCGVAGATPRGDKGHVRLNNTQVIDIEDLKAQVDSMADTMARYAEMIPEFHKMINAYNASLFTVNNLMQKSIQATALAVFYENLPRKRDGTIDATAAKDFYVFEDHMYSADPYTTSPDFEENKNVIAKSTTKADDDDEIAPSSYFAPLHNTELDERLFLTMADGEVHEELCDYFNEPGKDDKSYGGIDQWFIRSIPEETMVSANIQVMPMNRSKGYAPNLGICRVYKNANRRPLGGPLEEYRANHQGVGSDDSMPSCLNMRNYCPDQCRMADDTIALYADYEWSSGKYDLMCIHIHDLPTRKNPIPRHNKHIHINRAEFLESCDKHGGGSRGSHTRRDYRSCFSKSQFRHIPFLGETNLDVLLTYMYLDCPGYPSGLGSILSALNSASQFLGFSFCDGDWALTESVVRYTNSLKPNGYSRIYGDDKELCKESTKNIYTGAVAMPWILAPSFYSGDGTIVVGAARRQRNPLAWLVESLSPSGGDGAYSLGQGVYSAFDPVENGYIVAFSAARAAHRFHPSAAQAAASSAVAAEWRGSAHAMEREVRFDGVCYDDFLGDPSTTKFNVYSEYADLAAMRVGCVCCDEENIQRFARCWNLCETDWDAVLLPLRHAWSSTQSMYDSYSNNGEAVWTVESLDESGQTPFENAVSSGTKWMRFFDDSGRALVSEGSDRSESIGQMAAVPELAMREARKVRLEKEPSVTAGGYSEYKYRKASEEKGGRANLGRMFFRRVL